MVLNPFLLLYRIIIFYNKPPSTQWLQITILFGSWVCGSAGHFLAGGVLADSCRALSWRVDHLGFGAHVVPGRLSARYIPSSPPPSLPRCVWASKHNTSFCLCHSYWFLSAKARSMAKFRATLGKNCLRPWMQRGEDELGSLLQQSYTHTRVCIYTYMYVCTHIHISAFHSFPSIPYPTVFWLAFANFILQSMFMFFLVSMLYVWHHAI